VGRKGQPSSEPTMTIPQSVAEILKEQVTLEVEGIDRMYLNVWFAKTDFGCKPRPLSTVSVAFCLGMKPG
jgi:hypothetical protein